MVFIDFQHREVTFKLVYYGPALSGKTTNLLSLHRMVDAGAGGELMSLDTRDDRTLFFDLLPLTLKTSGGYTFKIKLFTVPGQVSHNATRKIVLQGADGVVFVADSRVSETRANNESFANLKQNLRENGIAWGDAPVVIQFNKRDMAGVRTDAEIDQIASKGKEPVFKAVAVDDVGVAETFLGLCALVWRNAERRYEFATRFGVSSKEFISCVRACLGAHGAGIDVSRFEDPSPPQGGAA